jgi:hypothetical protein
MNAVGWIDGLRARNSGIAPDPDKLETTSVLAIALCLSSGKSLPYAETSNFNPKSFTKDAVIE